MMLRYLFAGLIFFYSHFSIAFIECELAFATMKNLNGSRVLRKNDDFKIASYNILDFEYSPARQVLDEATGRKIFYPEKINKHPEDLMAIARIIKKQKLDIITMQEIQGKDALEVFNHRYLNDEYEVISLPGNDPRGYQVGFLIKKDLPLKFKVRSHRNEQEVYSVINKEVSIYSRDLPTLYIWKEGSDEARDPDLIIMGTHLKSQRDGNNDPKSKILRAAQVKNMQEQVAKHMETFRDTPLLLNGDFNADLISGEEFGAIKDSGLIKDSFEVEGNVKSPEQRITHSFHPRGGETSYSQMDAIFINVTAENHLNNSFVYRYKDEHGRDRPIPNSYGMRSRNPSDHFPVISNFKFSLFD